MFVASLWSGVRRWVGCCVVGIAAAVAGCNPSLHNPERLYPVPLEMGSLRDSNNTLIDQYHAALAARSLDQARAIRNEIIAQRMYAIDVQYSEYEAQLTNERQYVGFLSSVTTQGLTTAGALFTPATTVKILSGLAGAVNATRGYYDSEVLLAQSMRTIQKQMRASRSRIATHISVRTGQSVADYPLATALGDVEEYYRAGTLTTGIIDTSTTVGIEEDDAKKRARDIAVLPAQTRLAAVLRESSIPDVRQSLPLFRPPGVDPQQLFDRQVDAALCVQLTGQPRDEAIRDYLLGRRQIDPNARTVVITERVRGLLGRAVNTVRNCQQAGYMNAFEVGRYGVATAGVRRADISALQELLNVPVTGSLDAKTREAIAKERVQKTLKPALGAQIDADFLARVFQ